MTDDVRKTTEDALRRWGVTLDGLVARAPEVRENEALAIMGSITEGLSNEHSDIDLLYLGESELGQKLVMKFDKSYEFGISHDSQGREINIERLTFAVLEEMTERINAALETLFDPLGGAPAFVERNVARLKLYHRINNCLPLVNPEVIGHWRARMQLHHFAVYLCSMYTADFFNMREDVIGEHEAGQYDSAVWITKTQLGPTLAAAMLASVGETNTYQKWHYKLLRRHEAALGRTNVDAVLALICGDLTDTRESLLERIQDVSKPIINDIYGRHKVVYRTVHWFNNVVRHADPERAGRWKKATASKR